MDYKTIDYTVKSGDTLIRVVERFKNNELFVNRLFKTETDLDYNKVWDLKENKRSGYMCSDINLRKARKNEKWLYPHEKIALPYIKETILIYIPNDGKQVDLRISTESEFVFARVGYKCIVDAHTLLCLRFLFFNKNLRHNSETQVLYKNEILTSVIVFYRTLFGL